MGTKDFHCMVCDKHFKSEAGLNKHLRIKVHTKPVETSQEIITLPQPLRPDAPILVKCGNNYIDPTQVSSIREVKNGSLYIVKFKDDPNPVFPCWVNKGDIANLLSHFNVKEGPNGD